MSRSALYRKSDPDLTPVNPPRAEDVRHASGENEIETVRLVACPCCRDGRVPHVEMTASGHTTRWKKCWLCGGPPALVPENVANDWIKLSRSR